MPMQPVYLFVFDGFSDWEAAYAIAGINNPQFQSAPGRYCVQTVALQNTSVRSAGGLRIMPDITLEQITPEGAALFILPGGMAWDAGLNGEAVEAACRFLQAGVPVAAICGATAGLARGGLLDHLRHTSNAREYLATTQYRGGALYEDAPAVNDSGLITASGLAPVDFAQQIFRQLNLYHPAVLDAWYGLFKTGQAEYFAALMQAISE